MTIKELETRCGLDRATIRFYEKEGLLAPVRKANGYRDYSEEDALALEKIAFLRQLGLSLEIIRAIQQGELPLGVALEKQDEQLLARQMEAQQALHISRAIRAEGASYQTLQPQKYKAQLPPPAWQPRVIPPAEPKKHYATRHPWRRLFAREMDHMIYALPWVFVVACFLSVNSYWFLVLNWAATTASVLLLESLFLCTLGTTPGKWLMGLRLRRVSYDGPYKPDFGETLTRTAWAYFQGYGAGLGILQLICLAFSYLRANRGDEQPWDELWEYTAEEETRGSRIALLVAALVALELVTDGAGRLYEQREAVRNADLIDNLIENYENIYDLTLQQYVENVNIILAEDPDFAAVRHISLDEQGRWHGNEDEQNILDRYRLLIYTKRDAVVRIVCQTRFPANYEGVRPDAALLKQAAAMGLFAKPKNQAKMQDMVEDFWETGIGWCVGNDWEIRQETTPVLANQMFSYNAQGWQPLEGTEPVELFVKFTATRRDVTDEYP